MNEKEFDIEEKLNLMIEATMIDTTHGEQVEADIIAHVHTLEAKVERLRWHYPERGELPDFRATVLVEIISPGKVDPPFFCFAYDGTLFVTTDGIEIAGMKADQVKRWRYIDEVEVEK